MYTHCITEMVDALVKSKVIPAEKKTAAEKAIQSCWITKVAVSWDLQDIKDRAKEMGVKLKHVEAADILFRLLHKHDASVGINWDVIEEYIRMRDW